MKNKKRISILLGTILVAVVFVAGYYIAMAATYYWTQTGWELTKTDTSEKCSTLGGTWNGTECIAVHNVNNTWTGYSDKSGNANTSTQEKVTINLETAAETHSSVEEFSDDEASRVGVIVSEGGAETSGRLELNLP